MIELNFSNMMSDVIGEGGLTEQHLASIKEKAAAAHDDIARRKYVELGFIDLLDQDTSEIKAAARAIEGLEDFILLGIGGSALGPKTILDALSPMHNLRRHPRVFIYENVDPLSLRNILEMVDLSKAAVNVITKSGTTAETMSSFMVLYEKMKGHKGNIIATTDPEKGFLRKIALDDGLRTLPIPPGVGGRYSVLCPVGLLLAEAIGVDADELLAGAREMRERCQTPDIHKNPAYMFGALLYLMDKERGRSIDVMIPYSDRLKALSEWFCQLWAESLGKEGTGATPFPSVGTTDQHSQLQLWMEGPQDKVVTFLRIEDHGADVRIPDMFQGSGIHYLSGHTMGELINAEEESTELCLAQVGRPNMTIHLPKIDARHLGQIFYMLEIATAFAGRLYGINPFDQPSVELGKNFTYGMMGRPGYEAKKAEVEEARRHKAGWKV